MFDAVLIETHDDFDLIAACKTVKMCSGMIKCDTVDGSMVYTILFDIKAHFLQKPFTQAQLCGKIREALAIPVGE